MNASAYPQLQPLDEDSVNELLRRLPDLKREIQKVIVGQDEVVDQLLTAFLAGGHCLLEGVPGLAKTLMIRTLADAVRLKFNRIQFTPDLMPTDILGTEILEEDHSTGKRFFKFNRGPVFANVILADEINRTPPKTQSALLEAMQEGEVSYGGETYPLDRPFFVLATQNPIEQAGTYQLPEAQLDRFLLLIKIGYPDEAEEFQVLSQTTGSHSAGAGHTLSGEDVLRLQEIVRGVTISDELMHYVNRLVRSTRPESTGVAFVKEWVRWGAGPRAGQAMILTAKARAILRGRLAVTLADLTETAYPVLRHRILVNFRAEAERIDSDAITGRVLAEVARPGSPLH